MEVTPASAPSPSGDPTATAGSGLRQAWELLGEAAERRSLAWRRLAEAFHGPDGGWVADLLDGTLQADLDRAVSWLDSDQELYQAPLERLQRFVDTQTGRDPHEVELDLAVEHARLFVGPERVPAPPYESVWTDTDPMSGRPVIHGPSTDSVEAAYAEQGVGIAEDYHDLPDHVATEAEFVCYLCEREAEAWRQGLPEDAKALRAAQQQFLTAHLGRFAGEFCDAVDRAAPGDCYGAFVGLLRAHLTIETGTPYLEVVGSVWSSAPHPS